MKKFLFLLVLIPQVVFGAVTWNSADKGAAVILSNGDLTASTTGSWHTVRANISKSSGKWYWEQKLVSGARVGMIGVGTSGATLTFYIGSDTMGWSMYCDNGNKVTNSVSVAYGTACAVNDIIGIALDLDGDTISFYKNNTLIGTAFTGLTGTYYPAISPNEGKWTANFLNTSLVYSPPAGYSALETASGGGGTSTPDFGNYATGTALSSGDTTITFQLAVIIFILFLMVVGMFHNNLNKRQAWR